MRDEAPLEAGNVVWPGRAAVVDDGITVAGLTIAGVGVVAAGAGVPGAGVPGAGVPGAGVPGAGAGAVGEAGLIDGQFVAPDAVKTTGLHPLCAPVSME